MFPCSIFKDSWDDREAGCRDRCIDTGTWLWGIRAKKKQKPKEAEEIYFFFLVDGYTFSIIIAILFCWSEGVYRPAQSKVLFFCKASFYLFLI